MHSLRNSKQEIDVEGAPPFVLLRPLKRFTTAECFVLGLAAYGLNLTDAN